MFELTPNPIHRFPAENRWPQIWRRWLSSWRLQSLPNSIIICRKSPWEIMWTCRTCKIKCFHLLMPEINCCLNKKKLLCEPALHINTFICALNVHKYKNRYIFIFFTRLRAFSFKTKTEMQSGGSGLNINPHKQQIINIIFRLHG